MDEQTPQPTESQALAPIVAPQTGARALTVFARNPQEMAVAQVQLVQWAADKIGEVTRDRDELQENFDTATRNGWGYSGIGRQLGKAKKRLAFYEKVKAALDAGYCIVPGFPIDVFAIRTERSKPKKEVRSNTSTWAAPGLSALESESPALGDGTYVSGIPLGQSRALMEGDKHIGYQSWTTAFGEVDFPFSFAQPAVLHATAQAMAAKIFDELGVSPTRERRAASGDPMVIGRIYAPSDKHWQRATRHVSFVVAWFLRPDRDLDF